VVSAPNEGTQQGTGRLYHFIPVVHADKSLTLFLASTFGQGLISGVTNGVGDGLGAAMAARDLDGNGFTDLVVGVPGKNGTRGVIATFKGSGAGFGGGQELTWSFGLSGTTLQLPQTVDGLGASVAVADFDGDGILDVAAGMPTRNDDAGAIEQFAGFTGGLIDFRYMDENTQDQH
jgi:hypothetical protein